MFRPSTRLVPAFVLAALLGGCATTPQAGVVRVRQQRQEFMTAFQAELTRVGFQVEPLNEGLLVRHPDAYNFHIFYDEFGRRLVHLTFFELKEGRHCGDAAVEGPIALANRKYDLHKFYCDITDDTLGMEGATLIPAAGYTGEELKTYLLLLSREFHGVARESGLLDVLN